MMCNIFNKLFKILCGAALPGSDFFGVTAAVCLYAAKLKVNAEFIIHNWQHPTEKRKVFGFIDTKKIYSPIEGVLRHKSSCIDVAHRKPN